MKSQPDGDHLMSCSLGTAKTITMLHNWDLCIMVILLDLVTFPPARKDFWLLIFEVGTVPFQRGTCGLDRARAP